MPRIIFFACWLFFAFSAPAQAHFGMVIPSNDMVLEKSEADVTLQLSFGHPMTRIGMPLEKPASFKVFQDGQAADLTQSLEPARVMGQNAWQVSFTPGRPGVYEFVMQPAPYWEAAEDRYIVHYTKAYLAAFGAEEGWEKPLGLKTEIVPLTRAFGNYAGNVFRGRVLLDGEPVPGARVEVEFYNQDGKRAAPNEYMLTQVTVADDNGVFAYAPPFAGWWGFAALNTALENLDRQGKPKEVEVGAVMWVKFVDPLVKP